MTKMVRWLEPLGSGKYGYLATAPASEIIDYMIKEYQLQYSHHPNYPYKSDQEALDDFVAIHWAQVYDE